MMTKTKSRKIIMLIGTSYANHWVETGARKRRSPKTFDGRGTASVGVAPIDNAAPVAYLRWRCR